ncbi:MAG TPA: hypothetical protein VIT42_19610 [Microlunatus sp.]
MTQIVTGDAVLLDLRQQAASIAGALIVMFGYPIITEKLTRVWTAFRGAWWLRR